jgi:hypothetical protein
MGINIFPGQTKVWHKSTYAPEQDQMDNTKRWQRQQFADETYEMLPVVIGSVLYYSSVADNPHHTPVICHIGRTPDDNGTRPITRTAGNIPVEELELVWSSIRGLTD